MEIDGDLEMVRVAIATGPLLDGGDLRVQTFSNSVGDAMLKVGQHIGQMSGNQLGGLDHGRQAAVGRPEIPALPELGGPSLRLVAPQFPQRLPPRQNSCRLDMILTLGAIRMKDGTVRRSIQEQSGGAVAAAGEYRGGRSGERNRSVSADIGKMA